MTSLRRRLVLWLVTALTVASAIALAATYLKAREDIDALFDYQLQQLAFSLRTQPFSGPVERYPFDSGTDADFLTQVWDGAGSLIYFSRPGVELPPGLRTGFRDVDWKGQTWRVYTSIEGRRVFQVAHPLALRRAMTGEIGARLVVPMLALIPILALLVWVAVGRGLAPLKRIADAIERRSPASLEPLPATDLPEETRPLVDALNDLLDRLQRALASQREFIADAAHELRTPLTAVKLQIQLLESARTPAEREVALAQLAQGVQRSTHLTEQLLTMARLDPEAAEVRLTPVALDTLARSVTAERAALAAAKGLDLGVERADPVAVPGDAEGLRILLGNLLDNAIRYTPAGGRIDVSVTGGSESATLEVIDTGPGIPPAERARVFDRFYRRADADGIGTGLGLAIVKRIADRHRAAIELAEGPRGAGLTARVRFPLDPHPKNPPL